MRMPAANSRAFTAGSGREEMGCSQKKPRWEGSSWPQEPNARRGSRPVSRPRLVRTLQRADLFVSERGFRRGIFGLGCVPPVRIFLAEHRQTHPGEKPAATGEVCQTPGEVCHTGTSLIRNTLPPRITIGP